MPRPGTGLVHPRFLSAPQAIAEAAMRDTCRFLAPADGPGVLDEDTGQYTPPAPTVLWTGPCRVQPVTRSERAVEAGGNMRTMRPYQVTVPLAAPIPPIDTTVEVLTSADDPALSGARLRVVDITLGDFEAQRTFTCDHNES